MAPVIKGRRLISLFAYIFGARANNGALRTELVAADLGVSPRTVQNWIRNGLPHKRAEQFRWVFALDDEMLHKQRQQAEYARQLALDLHRGVLVMTPMWEQQKWLEPHYVEIVELTGVSHLHVVRLHRWDAERRDLARDGAVTVDEVKFPNRFTAAVAKYEVLEAVRDWRVLIPKHAVHRGGTEVWLEGAPRPSLQRLKRSLAARGVARHVLDAAD